MIVIMSRAGDVLSPSIASLNAPVIFWRVNHAAFLFGIR
jgi:hypothetical protein